MTPWIQKYSPLILFVLCLVLAGSAAFLWLQRPHEIPIIEPLNKETVPVKNPFQKPVEVYQRIGPPLLELTYSAPKLELPDLRNLLQYHGKNGRPDADTTNPDLYFSLHGGVSSGSVKAKEKLYLALQRDLGPAKFTFSPKNEETPLWITAEPLPGGKGNEVDVTLFMNDEKGEPVTAPPSNRFFKLVEREFPKSSQNSWEIGKWKVDATLLSRQRARWVGADKFLEDHGGEEYKESAGKQRIDFGDEEENYSLFVAPKEIYIYKDDRWRRATSGQDSINQPVLIVKKIDDRLMTLELWDVQGKNKVTLNLLRASDNFLDIAIKKNFKFVGARTRTQFVFEVNGQKMIIRPGDWYLYAEEGWKKLTTAKEIDDYVEHRLKGVLVTFDKVIRKEDKQVLVGTIYSPSRTEAETIDLQLQSGALSEARPVEKEDEEDDLPSPKPPQNQNGAPTGLPRSEMRAGLRS